MSKRFEKAVYYTEKYRSVICPCKYCGNKDIRIGSDREIFGNKEIWYVACMTPKCDSTGGSTSVIKEIKKWNKRHSGERKYKEMIIGYSKCDCGAITVYMENGESYSCEQKDLKKYFPGIDLRRIERYKESYCCDYCVNHYGLDLCGCGSGEKFGECTNDLPECERPMQIIGEYQRVMASDSWI